MVRASTRSCDGESGEGILASDRVTGNTNDLTSRHICCTYVSYVKCKTIIIKIAVKYSTALMLLLYSELGVFEGHL